MNERLTPTPSHHGLHCLIAGGQSPQDPRRGPTFRPRHRGSASQGRGWGEGAGRLASGRGAGRPSFPRRNLGLLTELGAGDCRVLDRASGRTRGRVLVCVGGRGMERRPRDSPFGPRARVCPGPPEGAQSSRSRTGRGRRRPGPTRRGRGEGDAVCHEVTGGAGRTRGARSPSPRAGLGPRSRALPPSRTSAHLREGRTWAGRPSPSRAGPAPDQRPCPAAPALTCTARLGHVPGGGLGCAARSSRLPARPRPPRRLRPERTPSAAPRPRPARLGRRHRSRRASPLPPAALKAPSCGRAAPRAAGEGLAEEGARRRPRRPAAAALQPAPLRPARPPQRAGGGGRGATATESRTGAEQRARERRGDAAVQTEMGTRTGVRGAETRRHRARERRPGGRNAHGEREKFGDRNSEGTGDPEPGTGRVTEPAGTRREEGRRDQGGSHEATREVAPGIRDKSRPPHQPPRQEFWIISRVCPSLRGEGVSVPLTLKEQCKTAANHTGESRPEQSLGRPAAQV